jgi:hypothetical protein
MRQTPVTIHLNFCQYLKKDMPFTPSGKNWFKEMDKLYGQWYCTDCKDTFWGVPSDHKVDPKFLRYNEVPLDYEPLRISGHSDGWLKGFGDPMMLEIKSVGAGTLRYEVPELLKENNNDVEKTWKAVKEPFMKTHYPSTDLHEVS